MTELEALIHFWETVLAVERWKMEITVMNQIELTIRKLKELKKLKGE